MIYLVKSIKWSNHYKKDTYWAPNKTGYVFIIAEAGIYTEDEANQIISYSNGNAVMIPFTKEIFDKAKKQLDKLQEEISNERENEEFRHHRTLEDIEKKESDVKSGYAHLENISVQFGADWEDSKERW